MDDPQIAAKREEAKRAMSLGYANGQTEIAAPITPSPTVTPTIDIPLIKPIPQASQSKDSMALAGQRLKAQMAMEGDERRKRREEVLRKVREAEELARQAAEQQKREIFEKERIEREKIEQETRIREQRERVSQQLKQQVKEVKAGGGSLQTIRTLKFDQDNLIKGQNLSIVGIAIKEEERRRRQQENRSISSEKNKPLLIASVVMILLGSGIGFYVYNSYYSAAPAGILPGRGAVTPSIVFADTTRSMDTTEITTDDLQIKIKNEIRNPPDLRLGAVENFVFSKKNPQGVTVSLSAEELLRLLGSSAPDSLLRALDRDYMFGILSSAENAAFIIVTTGSYDQALAGLLDWEGKTITKDLYPILTSLKPDAELLTKPYEDLLVKNVDTRALKDKDGNIRIIYGFIDGTKTIVIAGSKQAFTEALNRFNTPRPLSQ